MSDAPRGVSKYRDEFAAMAPKMAHAGMTDAQIADVLEASPAAMTRWKASHPAFADAMTAARADPNAMVAHSLYLKAIGYTDPDGKHYPPSEVACIFWLKNRLPREWRDRVEHTGADGGALKLLVSPKDFDVV